MTPEEKRELCGRAKRMTPEEKRELCGRAKRLVESQGDTVKAPAHHRRLRYEDDAVVIEWTYYEGVFPAPCQVTNRWQLSAKTSVRLGDTLIGEDQSVIASQSGFSFPWVRAGVMENLPGSVLRHLRQVMDE